MVHNHHYSPYKMYYPKAQGLTTVLPSNKKAPPLEGGNSIEIWWSGLIFESPHATNFNRISTFQWWSLLVRR